MSDRYIKMDLCFGHAYNLWGYLTASKWDFSSISWQKSFPDKSIKCGSSFRRCWRWWCRWPPDSSCQCQCVRLCGLQSWNMRARQRSWWRRWREPGSKTSTSCCSFQRCSWPSSFVVWCTSFCAQWSLIETEKIIMTFAWGDAELIRLIKFALNAFNNGSILCSSSDLC